MGGKRKRHRREDAKQEEGTRKRHEEGRSEVRGKEERGRVGGKRKRHGREEAKQEE